MLVTGPGVELRGGRMLVRGPEVVLCGGRMLVIIL